MLYHILLYVIVTAVLYPVIGRIAGDELALAEDKAFLAALAAYPFFMIAMGVVTAIQWGWP